MSAMMSRTRAFTSGSAAPAAPRRCCPVTQARRVAPIRAVKVEKEVSSKKEGECGAPGSNSLESSTLTVCNCTPSAEAKEEFTDGPDVAPSTQEVG
jgi:hypothetical protein